MLPYELCSERAKAQCDAESRPMEGSPARSDTKEQQINERGVRQQAAGAERGLWMLCE